MAQNKEFRPVFASVANYSNREKNVNLLKTASNFFKLLHSSKWQFLEQNYIFTILSVGNTDFFVIVTLVVGTIFARCILFAHYGKRDVAY